MIPIVTEVGTILNQRERRIFGAILCVTGAPITVISRAIAIHINGCKIRIRDPGTNAKIFIKKESSPQKCGLVSFVEPESVALVSSQRASAATGSWIFDTVACVGAQEDGLSRYAECASELSGGAEAFLPL